jgi:hypothetical protein
VFGIAPPSLIRRFAPVSGTVQSFWAPLALPGKRRRLFLEDPRSFSLVIEPADVAWSIEVAEGVADTRQR